MSRELAENKEPANGQERLRFYPLLDAFIGRRSRRFATGMKLNGGPLEYESTRSAEPLLVEEEPALAFAG